MSQEEIIKKYCPIIKPIELIGDSWILLIIKELLVEPKRFNQIKDSIPEITSRTLSAKLKFLISHNIVVKRQPPQTEYELTEIGHGLKEVILAIEVFGNTFLC
jgi:DNA-binding HxlR family transcriptional regulator